MLPSLPQQIETTTPNGKLRVNQSCTQSNPLENTMLSNHTTTQAVQFQKKASSFAADDVQQPGRSSSTKVNTSLNSSGLNRSGVNAHSVTTSANGAYHLNNVRSLSRKNLSNPNAPSGLVNLNNVSQNSNNNNKVCSGNHDSVLNGKASKQQLQPSKTTMIDGSSQAVIAKIGSKNSFFQQRYKAGSSMMIQENSGLSLDPATASTSAIRQQQQTQSSANNKETTPTYGSKLSQTNPRSQNYKTSALTQNVNTLRNSLIQTHQYHKDSKKQETSKNQPQNNSRISQSNPRSNSLQKQSSQASELRQQSQPQNNAKSYLSAHNGFTAKVSAQHQLTSLAAKENSSQVIHEKIQTSSGQGVVGNTSGKQHGVYQHQPTGNGNNKRAIQLRRQRQTNKDATTTAAGGSNVVQKGQNKKETTASSSKVGSANVTQSSSKGQNQSQVSGSCITKQQDTERKVRSSKISMTQNSQQSTISKRNQRSSMYVQQEQSNTNIATSKYVSGNEGDQESGPEDVLLTNKVSRKLQKIQKIQSDNSKKSESQVENIGEEITSEDKQSMAKFDLMSQDKSSSKTKEPARNNTEMKTDRVSSKKQKKPFQSQHNNFTSEEEYEEQNIISLDDEDSDNEQDEEGEENHIQITYNSDCDGQQVQKKDPVMQDKKSLSSQQDNNAVSSTQKSKADLSVLPPNPLLPKKMYESSPTKNGLYQNFIRINIRNNIEEERTMQGPVMKKHDIEQMHLRLQQEQQKQDLLNQQQNQKLYKEVPNSLPMYDPFNNNQSGNTNEQQIPIGKETSLRQIFYSEYRVYQKEGPANPIVYSRFGKKHYDSQEPFVAEKFQQLIRTFNIKNFIKQQMLQAQTNKYQNFSQQYYNQYKPSNQHSDSAAPIHRNYYIPKHGSDKTLVFESRFESGNLQLAQKLSDSEYNLILQNDVNSKGHTQWYYFRVQNVKQGMKVKFNMLNMIKSKSLYNEGMKVIIYSEKKNDISGKGWFRGGQDIAYFQNHYRKDQKLGYVRYYNTFTFTYTFEHDNDTVYFAYSQPYTYQNLSEDLSDIMQRKLDYVTRNTLCRTLAGNKCDFLTITSKQQSNTYDKKKVQEKKGVVISARVHPGESNASWMMKGLIDFLLGDSAEAKILRDNFVFKIIPMLNPDGVINGNYRCSLAGCDLNRRWKYPSQLIHPTIYYTKKLIKDLADERQLALFCDLHGHSRRKNVFIYGNADPTNQEASKVFPFLMSKIAGQHFSYDFCRFKVQKSKEQTARITMWRELRYNPNVFTMEASFCGPIMYPEKQQFHFTTQDLMNIGKNLSLTLLLYYSDQTNITQQIESLKSYHISKQPENQKPTASMTSSQSALQQSPSKKGRSLSSGPEKTLLQPKAVNIGGSQQTSSDNMPAASTQRSQSCLNNRQNNNGNEQVSAFSKLNLSNLTKDKIIDEIKTQNLQSQKIGHKTKQVHEQMIREDQQEHQLSCSTSSSGSDSEPSDDNLDAAQLKSIMPKKEMKKIKIQQKKKQTQNKISEKMQQVKKQQQAAALAAAEKAEQERKAQAAKENNSSAKPLTNRGTFDFKKPTKCFLSKFGQQFKERVLHKSRDAMTQTVNIGDPIGKSAMERDIMRHTGCKPSPILYPGYRGAVSNHTQPSVVSNVVPQKNVVVKQKQSQEILDLSGMKSKIVMQTHNYYQAMQHITTQSPMNTATLMLQYNQNLLNSNQHTLNISSTLDSQQQFQHNNNNPQKHHTKLQ